MKLTELNKIANLAIERQQIIEQIEWIRKNDGDVSFYISPTNQIVLKPSQLGQKSDELNHRLLSIDRQLNAEGIDTSEL